MREPQPVIISCALTGGMTVPGQSPAIPVTPEQIIGAGLEAAAAGASLIHVHVRDPATGRPAADIGLFREVIAGIREGSDAIVQPTTGGGVGQTIADRAEVLRQCRPEMASFNLGSFNFGIFPVHHRPSMAPWEIDYLESTRDYVFRNTFADMYLLAERFRENEITPEFEAYDVGHLYNLVHLLEHDIVQSPVHIQFVLGVLGANAASLEQLIHMLQTLRSQLGSNPFTWSVAGVGYPAEFHLGAASLMLGGHVRVGLEDNLRLTLNARADSNGALVQKAVTLAHLLDRRVATASEARRILNLRSEGVRATEVTAASGARGDPATSSAESVQA